jgi:hypothetical protein
VLHYPVGMGECNLGDCYDQAAHIPTAIVLQAWGIPWSAIWVLLLSMQTMQYVLKTGFGKSANSFGETTKSPNSGLGQGSGASPPAFMALSSLIVRVYHQIGNRARMRSSYTSQLFVLATVVYVNNTDLLHWPLLAYTSPEDLIDFVQKKITDWGLLSQASGGILKPPKCLVYFLDYKFVGGQAKMKSLQDLPEPTVLITEGDRTLPLHITIPQPDGSSVPIVNRDVTTTSKVLGVNFMPAGNCLIHVEQMVQKGLDWVECLITKPVPRCDAWLSFYLQLLPAIAWGLVTVCLHPKKLDAMIQWVYKKALPSLGVNRKIKKKWRTLPEMYQGLTLPNFPC